ncbi:hypothetical protein L3i22_083290 [Actinoplanes sp. L3-i22]|nr:hypothetical protein L3i22_083290 [Actinoplanes sp. L3-i22]
MIAPRRLKWFALAVVLASLAGCVDGPSAEGPAPSAVASSAPRPARSAPACKPTVTETGFNFDGQTVQYGIVTRNSCPYAVYNASVKVHLLDPSGATVAASEEESPNIVVMLPGQELAGAGRFYLDKEGAEIGKVEAAFDGATPVSASAFAGWPREVRVVDVKVGAADGDGRSTVTGRIVTDPSGAGLCAPAATLILRNKSGKIIYGMNGRITADQFVEFTLALPKATDRSKTTVQIALGQPALSLTPVATAACLA